jgi:putative DNA primase/helicase
MSAIEDDTSDFTSDSFKAFDEASNAQLDALTLIADRKQVAALPYDELLRRKFSPRKLLLAPWLPQQGIVMAHAPRGIGKTHLAHGIAWTVAVGGSFLRWSSREGPHRVLLLDGEMPGVLLQERLREVVKSTRILPPSPDYFKIAAADLRSEGLPDLADPKAQPFYMDIIADADLVIADNVSTLCRSLKENDADSWAPVQAWCLDLRRRGKSVLLIHHDGKNGGQRGTSKKEDVLDTVIGLRRPPNYNPDQGARFEVHFEKARGFFGADAEAFEARLIEGVWGDGPVSSGVDDESLASLHRLGMSYREMERRTGVSRSTLQRRLGQVD